MYNEAYLLLSIHIYSWGLVILFLFLGILDSLEIVPLQLMEGSDKINLTIMIIFWPLFVIYFIGLFIGGVISKIKRPKK